MQNIESILTSVIDKVKFLADKNNYDKYVKNHFLHRVFIFLLMQHSSNEKYGRALTRRLNDMHKESQPFLVPSQGELSKKLSHKLPLNVWVEVYHDLVNQLSSIKNRSKELSQLSKQLKIIDSSTFQASLSMSWAEHRKTARGLKLHMMIDSNLVPEDFRLEKGKTSDKKWLKWAIKEGFIYAFDRGYNDYAQFQWITDHKAFFVTRALSNIKYETLKDNEISKQQKDKGILFDKIIEVVIDKKKNIKGQLRLIRFRFRDTKGIMREFSFITNLFDLPSDVIAEIYKERWQIETFFQWIKMHTELRHWISRSKNGVRIQLYSSLILYLMNKLAEIIGDLALRCLKDYSHKFNNLFMDIIINYRNRGDPLLAGKNPS